MDTGIIQWSATNVKPRSDVGQTWNRIQAADFSVKKIARTINIRFFKQNKKPDFGLNSENDMISGKASLNSMAEAAY